MSQQQQNLPLGWQMLTAGTAASIAETLTIPFDTGKVRLQVDGQKGVKKYNGLLHCLKTVAKEEGPLALWAGLSAGIQRQYVFGSLRLGMYEPIRDFIANGKEVTLITRIVTGLISGTLAMAIASPTDLVKVRLQIQGRDKLIDPQSIKYNGLIHAYKRIYAEEGLLGFWTGVVPNCARNAIVNAAELATFDQVKSYLLKKKLIDEGITCQFVCSAVAGVVASVVGSPVDVVKSRLMGQKAGSQALYTGLFDCISKTYRNEGFLAFYNGLQANATRIVSWNIAMFVVWGELKRITAKKLYDN